MLRYILRNIKYDFSKNKIYLIGISFLIALGFLYLYNFALSLYRNQMVRELCMMDLFLKGMSWGTKVPFLLVSSLLIGSILTKDDFNPLRVTRQKNRKSLWYLEVFKSMLVAIDITFIYNFITVVLGYGFRLKICNWGQVNSMFALNTGSILEFHPIIIWTVYVGAMFLMIFGILLFYLVMLWMTDNLVVILGSLFIGFILERVGAFSLFFNVLFMDYKNWLKENIILNCVYILILIIGLFMTGRWICIRKEFYSDER